MIRRSSTSPSISPASAFPICCFMSLTALQSGVLNSLNRFTAAAAAPILLNLVHDRGQRSWPGTSALGNTADDGLHLCLGHLRGGYRAVPAAGDRLPARRDAAPAAHAEAHARCERRVIRLSIPGIISGGITQINLVIATMIATTHRPRRLLPLLRRSPLPVAAWASSASPSAWCCCRICRASSVPARMQARLTARTGRWNCRCFSPCRRPSP